MTSLSNILKFYLHPRTVKIESGTITSEEGSEIGPGDVVTVYAGGIKIYVSPEEISMLKGEEEQIYFRSTSSEYGNTFTADHIVKSLFISNKEELLDQHYQKKVYTNVFDILADKPPFVVANDDFMTFSANENQGMRKVKKGDKLELTFDTRSTRTEGVVLKAIIETDIVMLLETSKLNVTGCFDNDTLYNTNSIVEGTMPLPRVMSFANEDTHELFRSQTGFGRIVINDSFKYAMCLAKKLGKAIERVSGDFGVIKRVRCFDVDMDEIKDVKVQIIKDSAMENVKIKFAKEAGIDNNGFKFYDLYLQVKGEIKRDYPYEEMRPIPPREAPPSDSDSDTGSYEEPCEKRKEAEHQSDKAPSPPPRPPRANRYPISAKVTIVEGKSIKSRTASKLSFEMTYDDADRADRVTHYPADSGPNFIRGPSEKRVEISENFSTKCQIHQRPVFDNESNTKIQIPSQYESTESVGATNSLEKPSLRVKPIMSPTFAPELCLVSKPVIAPPDSPDELVSVIEDQEHPIKSDVSDTLDDTDIGSGCNDGASNIAFSDLSVSQLADILNGQNLEKMAKICEENKIDGKFLLTFSDDDLKTDPFKLNWLEIKKLTWMKDGNMPKV